ncbi:MAG: Tim44 domain-containing protein [Desulfobacteraceae bacterium]|nr:MAG: Tim44 domain-containing protein [Desulfobacteraceae bacterium]
MQMITLKKVSIAALFMVFIFLIAGFAELAEARSRGGGRSFGRSQSRSVSKPAPPPSAQSAAQSVRPATSGGAFSRGLAGGIAGGLMGGMIGNMLFGGTAHGSGMGGMGGSGFGMFEILLLAGLGYFLYKKFYKGKPFGAAAGAGSAYARSTPEQASGFFGQQDGPEVHAPPADEDDPLVAGVQQIWRVDETFHPDRFKETAQDLFFKIQAGWTRREINALKGLVGEQLLGEYDRHFTQMKEKGQFNRLENIAVRNVDLVQAGVDGDEIFVTVRFTANLLDYTVDERSGEIISGDRENPVKFDENWTFARPVGSSVWKLEGIEVL